MGRPNTTIIQELDRRIQSSNIHLNKKFSNKIIVPFFARLIKEARSLWRLRFIEVHAAASGHIDISRAHDVASLLALMSEYTAMTSPNQRRYRSTPQQSVITHYVKRTPRHTESSQSEGTPSEQMDIPKNLTEEFNLQRSPDPTSERNKYQVRNRF